MFYKGQQYNSHHPRHHNVSYLSPVLSEPLFISLFRQTEVSDHCGHVNCGSEQCPETQPVSLQLRADRQEKGEKLKHFLPLVCEVEDWFSRAHLSHHQ